MAARTVALEEATAAAEETARRRDASAPTIAAVPAAPFRWGLLRCARMGRYSPRSRRWRGSWLAGSEAVSRFGGADLDWEHEPGHPIGTHNALREHPLVGNTHQLVSFRPTEDQ